MRSQRDNVFNFVVSPEDPVRRPHRRAPGRGARQQPLPDACRRGQRGAPHRGQGPPGRFALERRSGQRASVVILNDAPIAPRPPSGCRRSSSAAAGSSSSPARRRHGRRSPTSCPAVPARRRSIAGQRRGSARSNTAIRSSRCSAGRGPATSRPRGSTASRASPPAQGRDARAVRRWAAGAARATGRTGRVLMWTSTLDTDLDDLRAQAGLSALRPSHRRYLGAYREPRPWRTVGDVVDPRTPGAGEGLRTSRGSR